MRMPRSATWQWELDDRMCIPRQDLGAWRRRRLLPREDEAPSNVCMHVDIHVYTHVHEPVCPRVYTHVYTRVYTHAYTQACARVYTNIHTQAATNAAQVALEAAQQVIPSNIPSNIPWNVQSDPEEPPPPPRQFPEVRWVGMPVRAFSHGDKCRISLAPEHVVTEELLSGCACMAERFAFFENTSERGRWQPPRTCTDVKVPRNASHRDLFDGTVGSVLALGVCRRHAPKKLLKKWIRARAAIEGRSSSNTSSMLECLTATVTRLGAELHGFGKFEVQTYLQWHLLQTILHDTTAPQEPQPTIRSSVPSNIPSDREEARPLAAEMRCGTASQTRCWTSSECWTPTGRCSSSRSAERHWTRRRKPSNASALSESSAHCRQAAF